MAAHTLTKPNTHVHTHAETTGIKLKSKEVFLYAHNPQTHAHTLAPTPIHARTVHTKDLRSMEEEAAGNAGSSHHSLQEGGAGKKRDRYCN
jgi:hypothetical protein